MRCGSLACFTATLLPLYCYFTTALLLLYYCFTKYMRCGSLACFTATLLLLYCYFTTALRSTCVAAACKACLARCRFFSVWGSIRSVWGSIRNSVLHCTAFFGTRRGTCVLCPVLDFTSLHQKQVKLHEATHTHTTQTRYTYIHICIYIITHKHLIISRVAG